MRRILIADDHEVVRRGAREILEDDLGESEFVEASDFPGLLRLVGARSWDLVIMDVGMPGGNAIEAVASIRAMRPGLPVLVLSIHPEDQYATRLLRAGARGYLTKQALADELVAAVRRVLSGGTYVSGTLAETLARWLVASDRAPHESLSDREYEVLLLIASGKSVSEIGKELHLSVKTVSTYRARILEKMGMSTNADLIRYAIARGLVT